MIAVRLLGPVEIQDAEGRALDALLRRPKRVALLAYLCAATPSGYHRRDKLIGLFWPEMTQEQARRALSQALHVLRIELGEGAILTRGEGDVGVNCEVVTCDVTAFDRAVVEGRYAEALELYRGDLLEGYFISEAPEFGRWLDDERTRLRERAAGAAWALAHEHIGRNDLVDAERTAQRALLLVGTDESEVRRFIAALADAGDRAAAVRFYEKFAERLRGEYELEPAAETKQLADAIRTRTEAATQYRGEGDVRVASEETAGVALEGRGEGTSPVRAEAQSPARGPRWRNPVVAAGLFGLGAVAVVAAIAIVAAGPRDSRARLDPNHVVVAAFRNATGDSTLDLLGERLGHWVTQGVQQAAIPAMPWDVAIEVWEYVQAEVEAGRVRDPIRAMAEETNAGVVVSGAVYLAGGDSLEVQANVTDVRRDRPLGTLAPIRGSRLSDAEILSSVQQRVVGLLAFRFDERVVGLADVIGQPPSYEAYREFREGMAFDMRDSPRSEEVIEYFRRAAELDSTWYLPLINLAIQFMNMGRPAEADSALTRLEGFGDRLTPFARASVRARRGRLEGDRVEFYGGLRRAAELAPQSGIAWNAAYAALRIANRPGEAVEILSRADPESYKFRNDPIFWTTLGNAYHKLGKYERAIETVEHARQIDAERCGTWCLGVEISALAALGRTEELGAVLDETMVSEPGAMGAYLVWTVELLRAHGHHDLAGDVVDRAFRWFDSRPPDVAKTSGHRANYGQLLILVGRHHEAREIYAELAEEFDYWQTHGGHGWLAATLGDTAQALAEIDWLERHQPPRGSFSNSASMWCLQIYGALGDDDRVTELLRDAHNWWEFSHHQREVVVWNDPIRDHPAFKELMRPKG